LVLNKLLKNKYINLFIILNIGLLMLPFWIFSYNFVILLLTLIILNYELKSKDEKLLKLNIKNDFLIGIVAGLAIITKQSTGFFIAATYVGYKWLAVRSKEDLNLAFKISLSRGVGVLVPVTTFFLYLFLTNSILDFFDFCFLGISEFKNYISYMNLLDLGIIKDFLSNVDGFYNKLWIFGKVSIFIIIAILALMMFFIIPFTVIYLIKKLKFDSVESKNILKLFVFGIASFLLVYPIADYNHFAIGALILIILSIYIVSINFKIGNEKVIKYFNKFIIVVFYIVVVLLVIVAGRNYYEYIKNENKNHSLNHYNGVIIDKSRSEKISAVNQFIEQQEMIGKNVYIINADSCFYTIPIDKYEKYFDLLLKGNLGQKGVQKVIDKIEGLSDNSLFLILNDSTSLNWQFPKEVIEFIRNNYNNVGSIANYDIYSKER